MGGIVSVGTLVLQGAINSLGVLVIAGHTAARKLYFFCITPISTMAMALSTFVSQNFGAGKMDRVRRAVRAANPVSYTHLLLAPGNYLVVEHEAPEGFALDETERLVAIVSGQIDQTYFDAPVNNTALYGRFYLEKVDGGTGARLAAEFTVYKWDGQAYAPYPSAEQPLSFTTPADGIYRSPFLPAGQ